MSRYLVAILLGLTLAFSYTWITASFEALGWSGWNLIDWQAENYRLQAHGSLLASNAGIRDQKPLPPFSPRLSPQQRGTLVSRGYQLLVQKRLIEDGARNALLMTFLCVAWVRFLDRRKVARAPRQ
jgi:hypothetical protein